MSSCKRIEYEHELSNNKNLQRINIKAASAAINRMVTTAKKMIKYSIGISFFDMAANESNELLAI